MIVSGIINPESVPQVIEKARIRSTHERTHAKAEAPKLSAEEKTKIRDDKYKSFVLENTGGNVVVEKYNGATEKADYRCTLCGNRWSTRPDHFKDRQKFKCPNCHSKTA